MEIRKRRCGEISKNERYYLDKEEKGIYFIEDIFNCSLYQISEIKIAHTKIRPFKIDSTFIKTNIIWQG